MKRKLIAFLVALCLLLTGLPGTPVKANAAEAEKESASVDTSALAALPAYQPEGDCKILNYVHVDVFAQGDHVARLESEESLSSYVFLNRDGTKTVYYLDEVVKFEAADGRILEKDLTLRSEKGGYATTQNDVSLHLPASPASGVRLSYNNKQVTLIPQGGSATAASDGKAVRYANYYGPGMDLVYTPTMDGVKEEIILSAYSGVNSFTFLLNTGGLNLYQSANRYFLAESKVSDSKIWLGALEIFDSAIQPGPGNVTVETVKAGQQYRITLTVDEDYLTDPNTIYPVTIDPTLTVSDNTHGAGAIEDAPIYEGYPTSNFGSYQYNRAGYAGTTYKRGRTVVRLTGLFNDSTFSGVSAGCISSAKFYVYDATGSSTAWVNLYPLTSNTTWTESSVTWSNQGSQSEAMSEDYGAVAMLGNGQQAEFIITQLVKAWKNGTLNYKYGFVLQGAVENTTDRSMYSSEHTTTGKRPYAVVNYDSWLNYTSLVMNRGGATKTLQLNHAEGTVTFTNSDPSVATVSSAGVVTPVQIGTTTITARDTAGNEDTCTVTVVLPTGIYQFINKKSGLYMHTKDAGISSGTNIVQSMLYGSSLNQKAQLWRVNHLGGGRYSIRPLHKPDMGLSAASGAVSLLAIGDVDTRAGVHDNAEWTISYTNGSYRVCCGESTSDTLKVLGNSASNGASLRAEDDSSSNLSCRWNIVSATAPAPEILLYDKETEQPLTTQAYHVKPGQTLTPEQYGLAYAYADASSWNQALRWTSSDPSKVSVNPTTGAITGVTTKTFVTITVSKSGSTAAAKTFTVYCSPYVMSIDVVYDMGYAIRHDDAAERLTLQTQSLCNKFFNEFGVYIRATVPSAFTSHADECNVDPYTECECYEICVNSGKDDDGNLVISEYHHKNITNIIYRISNPEEYDATIAFTGHNCCIRKGLDHLVDTDYAIFGVTIASRKVSLIAPLETEVLDGVELETIIHEFGHLFNVNNNPAYALDHYSVVYDDFRDDCIYGYNFLDESVRRNLSICGACKTTLQAAIEEYMSS